MNLLFPHSPSLFLLTLDSQLARLLATHALEKNLNLLLHHQSPDTQLPFQLEKKFLRLQPEAFSHLTTPTYSVILDPYLFDSSSFLSPEKLFTTLKLLTQHSRTTLFISSASLLSPKAKTPQWQKNSTAILTLIQQHQQQFPPHSFTTIYTSDLYSTHNTSRLSPASFLFTQLSRATIPFPFSGEELLHPLFDQDLAQPLFKRLFGHQSSSNQLHLQSSQSLISLNFAYKLAQEYQQLLHSPIQRQDLTDYQLIHRDLSTSKTITIPSSNLEHNLRQILSLLPPAKTPTPPPQPKPAPKPKKITKQSPTRKKKTKKRSKTPILLILLLITLLGFVLTAIGTSPSLINAQLKKSQPHLTPPHFTIQRLHQTSTQALSPLMPHLPSVQAQQLSNLLNNNQFLLTSHQLNQGIAQFYQQVIKSDSTDINQTLTQLNAQSQTDSQFHQSRGDTATAQKLNMLARLTQAYPAFINYTGQANIALLILNDQELRPAGGYLSQVIILNFDQGKLINLTQHDVFQLDSQLNGQVQPPADLESRIGESSWFLRDSNWDPNFATSADRAAWFIQKQTNTPIHGVIGLTTTGIEQLMGESSFDIPGLGQISAQNVQHHLFNQASSNGSQDFLPQFLKVFQFHLTNLDGPGLLQLAAATHISLSSKNLLLYSPNPAAQNIFTQLDLTGEITPTPCALPDTYTCQSQTFHLNEANTGINQVNRFISRQESHQTTISSTTISQTHTLTLTNTAPTTSFPGGVYKVYLRAYLPQDSSNINVAINQSTINNKDLTRTKNTNFIIIGLPINIGVGESSDIEINYTTPAIATLDSFQHTFIKQPGTPSHPFTYSLILPDGINLSSPNNFNTLTTQEAQFNFDSNHHLLFAFN